LGGENKSLELGSLSKIAQNSWQRLRDHELFPWGERPMFLQL